MNFVFTIFKHYTQLISVQNLEFEYIFPIEIWNIIFDYSNLVTQLRLIGVCKYFNKQLHLTNLYDIDYKYIYRLTTDILKRYPYIVKLYANNNVTDVTYLKHLRVLKASYYMNNDSIKDINLYKLIASYSEITDVNHMTNLEYLDAGSSTITNDGVKNINPVELDIHDNFKIYDINHMSKLKILHAGGKSAMTSDGIKSLKLDDLFALGNSKLKKLKS